MFKIYHIAKNGHPEEVRSDNGMYIVYELFEYKLEFVGDIIEEVVFIEDEVFDAPLNISQSKIIMPEKRRIFEDYFGYLTITINQHKYNFEVRIQKLKVPELEDILLYLWNQDPIIFNNLFSKSTLKAKLSGVLNQVDFSSKFVNIFDDFYNFFRQQLFSFTALPHYLLRSVDKVTDYDTADISSGSIDWLVNNLDELHIDYLYRDHPNSIEIGNNYGLVENILTEEKTRDINVYENQIILGAFDYIKQEIKRIKHIISVHILAKQDYEKDFYSINEFKIIPFVKLKVDLERIENKIKLLNTKYKSVFPNTKARNAFPKLTPVFSNKKHYSESYSKIKLIRDIKIELDGELNLINIKKISTLYERYNLFEIVNSFLKRNPTAFKKANLGADNVYREFYFQFGSLNISVFYDRYISNRTDDSGLQRISFGYYKPDYIIKAEDDNGNRIYILDSKYSSESTVRNNHLSKCIKSYILDIGITGSSNQKIEELILIYPGETESVIFGSTDFKPKVGILPSKVNKKNLEEFIARIFKTSE